MSPSSPDPRDTTGDAKLTDPLILDCAGRAVDLGHPQVMGILNITPDSFSDGGLFLRPDAALAQAERMLVDGAAIIDVGGESTRPGANRVDADEECRRVAPVIEAIVRRLPVAVSVDTSRPAVMRAAQAAGAGLINDVRALREPGALETAAVLGLPVCLIHMQGEPRDMQEAPHYEDVLAEVGAFLTSRLEAAVAAGIPPERLLLDPGFGFGKTLAHNLILLARLSRLATIGPPLLVGLSRKSMLGAITGRPVAERLPAGVAAAVLAVQQGARVVRTHDVAATVDALRIVAAVAAA